jgi:hypothetical protein
MIDATPQDITPRDATALSVKALELALRELPQVEPVTEHYFADGMYCRMVARDAGVLVVGKVHKREHFYMVVKGSVAVVQDGAERKVYHAPAVIVSKVGTKRATLALTDAVCLTVHRTDKTDLDEIEAELIEPEPDSLFDSGNKLKFLEYTI